MLKNCLIALIGFGLMGWAAKGISQNKQFLEIAYFDEAIGLEGLQVLDILQDKVGYLWLATGDGLIRYDGYAFRAFRHVPGDTTSIVNNGVKYILEDKKGNIWIGHTRGGVSRYDRNTGHFRNYPFTLQLKPSTATVNGLFFDKDGQLWVGVSDNGLVRLDTETGKFEQYPIATAENSPHLNPENVAAYNTAYTFFQDENGEFWLGSGGDLYVFNPKTGKARPWRPVKKPAPGTFGTDHAHYMLPDGDLLWTGGWLSGLRCINRKTGAVRQWFFYPGNEPHPSKNILNDVTAKGTDEIWVTTTDRGLGIFNKRTEQFHWLQEYPEELVGGEMPTKVAFMTPDNQGNLWTVADDKLARIRLRDKQFHRYELIPNKYDFGIFQVLEDREGRFFFVGTQYAGGLYVFDKKTGERQVLDFWAPPTDPSLLVMDMLQARDGTIWVLTYHSVLRFNPITRKLETPPQPTVYAVNKVSNGYTEFVEDAQGNLWLGTALNGLIRFDPKSGQGEQFLPKEDDPNSIPTHVIGSVEVDGRGRIWFGSRGQTAYGYYQPKEQKCTYLDAEGNVTANRATVRTNSFFAAQNGDIYACTEEGLLHFDCSGERPVLRKKYTVADGLPINYVVHGVEDKQGNFWAITSKIVRIDKQTQAMTLFGKNDGVDFVPNRFTLGLDGTIYVRTENGVYGAFNPAMTTIEKTKVPIALTSFKVDGIERYYGSGLAPANRLVVPSDSRYFSVEFAALDLTRAEEREYEYRLEGFDNEWVKCQENRFVNFTNIPAGRYTFQVKPAGAPESEALAVPLVVHVAFYKTGWFWAIIVAALAGMVFAYFRNRQRQRQRMAELLGKAQLLEKEKALVQYEGLKQQLNPHFLFNSLTSLGSLISIDPRGATTFLDSLSKTYRYILKSSERETVPLVEELKFGETFVKLQKTRFGEGLQVNFKVDEADFHRKIVPVTLQNLIENAIKHNIIDEEEPLVVDVFVEDGHLVVRNNLQKKKFVETSNKRGLSNLQSFYRYLSDKPIVVAEDEAFFTIKIPLI